MAKARHRRFSQRHRTHGRARAPFLNVIRPSPALVSFVDRTLGRLTNTEPWTSADSSVRDAALSAPTGTQDPPGVQSRRQRSFRDADPVPEAVRAHFVQVGKDYYFEDGARAFRDHGHKLTSRSENNELVRSLIAIALVRGWQEITVSGSERFRRRAWREATVTGLLVRGYKPTEFEQARLVRDVASARKPAPPRVPLVEPSPSSSPTNSTTDESATRATLPRKPRPVPTPTHPPPPAASSVKPAKSNAPRESDSATATRRRELVGALVKHGYATYEFHPHGEPSYYVTLKTSEGERTLWGVDLERAIREAKSAPQVGDEVTVRRVAREKVKVLRREVSPEGELLGQRPIEAERNRWAIEKSSFLEERAVLAKFLRDPSADPPDVRQIPALSGSYLVLKGAAAFAKEQIADAESRAKFLAKVREQLARAIEAGETIAPPRLRERSPIVNVEPKRVRTSARTLS